MHFRKWHNKSNNYYNELKWLTLFLHFLSRKYCEDFSQHTQNYAIWPNLESFFSLLLIEQNEYGILETLTATWVFVCLGFTEIETLDLVVTQKQIETYIVLKKIGFAKVESCN